MRLMYETQCDLCGRKLKRGDNAQPRQLGAAILGFFCSHRCADAYFEQQSYTTKPNTHGEGGFK